MHCYLKNSVGILKDVKVGFSWTNLFFGVFVPLFRADWKWFGIQFIVNILCVCVIGFPLTSLIFPFVYNKCYIQDLLNKGYFPANEEAERTLNIKGIIA